MSRIDELIRRYAPNGVEYKALGEVGTFVRGNGLQKRDFVEDGFPCIHYGQIYTHYGTWTTATRSFVSNELAARLRKAKTGDLIIATTSENMSDVGKSVVWLGDGEVAFGGHTSVYSHTLDPLYVAYFFQSEMFQKQKSRHVSGTKVKELPFAGMARIRIPVPALEIQQEVARTLAMMEALEAELKAELEAELEARREQYIHHRAELMSFHLGAGVRWLALSDVLGNRDRERKPITRSARQEGQYPYYGANGVQDYVDAYIFDGTFLLMGEDGSVVRSDGTPYLNWATGKFWVNNHAHVLYSLSPELDLRFAFHYLHTVDIAKLVTGGTQPKLNQKNMNAITLPVPPIDEQKHIVSVLDTFHALVNELSTGLPAEITARRQQYEYYRDRLLSFEEAPV